MVIVVIDSEKITWAASKEEIPDENVPSLFGFNS